MPQSLTFVLVHVVFSTQGRAPLLRDDLHRDLYAYMATVARDLGCECYRAGGIADHVHLAIGLARTITIADLVEKLKTTSSRWLKAQGVEGFAWQRGYGAFSVGRSDFEALMQYIATQEAHHRRIDFRDELRAILKRYEVASDEQYLWD